MGFLSWIIAALMAAVLCRPLRVQRLGFLYEVAAAAVVAIPFGLIASGADFGGWGVFDARAFAFVFFGSLSSIAIVRTIQGSERARGDS